MPSPLLSGRSAVKVSVIVPAYNASAFLRQSVESILSQTFVDFELIVVDDCSTDDTAAILATYGDPRLRIIHNPQNLGVVRARNRAMDVARGEYVASFDADDISLPLRLARQVAFLDANPAVGLVGTASRYLEGGTLRPGRRVDGPTPMLVRWLLHVSNPLVHPSLMYRADAVRRLGVLLRDEFKYAEDFDLHHRMLGIADVAFIDEPLILYRRHPAAITIAYEHLVLARAAEVLTTPYRRWFGDGAAAAATLVVTHIMARKPVGSVAELQRLRDVLSCMTDGFQVLYSVVTPDRTAIARQGAEIWRNAVQAALRSGLVGAAAVPPPAFSTGPESGLVAPHAVSAMIVGLVPFKPRVRQAIRQLKRTPSRPDLDDKPAELLGTIYEPMSMEQDQPPTLFVVVDTEAEFDWTKPFSHCHNGVEAMAALHRGQAVFDRYGLRPIYVVDYPVASKPAGYGPLLEIHRRGGCEIGAHLHPWTNPPFVETMSTRNSFAGNLPPELEEEKFVNLLRVIRDNLQVHPRFFKAGRYGVGPNTMSMVARHGIAVDLSIMPGRTLTAQGGPDFRAFGTMRRSLLGGRLTSVPMTRGSIGPLGALGGVLAPYLAAPVSEALHVPGILARSGLLETVTLTPEGETAKQQIALIRAMLARRQNCFVLHYHSPSLTAGFTPYAQTAADADVVVQRLDAVCRFFFDEVGGAPGYPQDLLPPGMRTLLGVDAAARVVSESG